MYCKNCGHNLEETNKFCTSCGFKVSIDDISVQNKACEQYGEMVSKDKKTKNKLFGFRSGKWYKKLIAIIYLIFMFMLFFPAVFSADSLVISTHDKIISKISDLTLWITMILPYLIMSNIFGLRTKIPLYKSKKKFPKIIAFVLTVFIMLIVSINIDNLHTQDYKERKEVENELRQQEEAEQAEIERLQQKAEEQTEIESLQQEAEEQAEIESLQQEAKEQEEALFSEEITDNTLRANFVEACKEIGVELDSVKNLEKIADWAGGERYSFTYSGLSLRVYCNANLTINTIKFGVDTDIYKQGYESYQIDDYIVSSDMQVKLKLATEDIVKSQLNYPSTASFGWLDWSYGRERNLYSTSGSVKAKNAFGVEDEMSFQLIYNSYDSSMQTVYFLLDGNVIVNDMNTIAEEEREQIEGFYIEEVIDIPDDISTLTPEEVYNNYSQYDSSKVRVKGEIVAISNYTDLTGYYLLGVRGNGLVCWVYESQQYNIGDTVEFYGTVYGGSNVEISNCVVIE